VRIIIVGPGRAGGAIAAAAQAGGLQIVGVFARRPDDHAVANHLSHRVKAIGSALPEADLMIVAVRDDALGLVAEQLAAVSEGLPSAVHLSGLAPTTVLDPLARVGVDVGSFHPLQTLPDWQTGARSLAGSHVAVTAGERLSSELAKLAESFGATVFHIPDRAKPLYHAAAAASANYVIAALALGQELFEAAGVDPAVARPLVKAVVANAFELGALASLTGPIARGEVGTVAAQVEAVTAGAPACVDGFKAMGRVTAELAGRSELMREALS